MTRKIFIEHGEISCNWINDLLLVHVTGPFNIEGITAFSRDIANIVEHANLPRWARIEVFLNGDVMGPREALTIVESNIQHSKSNGCIGIAVVGANILAKEAMAEMCRHCSLDFQVFDSLSEAVSYSRKLLDGC